MKPLNEDDFHDDLQVQFCKIRSTRQRNSELAAEIESMGRPVDVALARTEHFIDNLVREGILPQETYIRINLDWEEHLNSKLKEIKEAVEARLREMQRQQRLQMKEAAKRLNEVAKAQAGKQSIIVPPGSIKGLRADGKD